MEKEKSILVTGCSSGIGKGIAGKFVKEGYLVFGSVRKKEDADILKEELGEQFFPLIMDITKVETIKESVKKVTQKLDGKGLGGLINNAGIAIYGPLSHMSMKEVKNLFEVNTFGPLAVTKAFLPLLGMQENQTSAPGRIINISSAAGQISVPFIGGYSGSKHALEGITHSLRQEVKRYGIDVVIVAPGFVNTAIAANLKKLEPYENTDFTESLNKFSETTLMQLEKEGHTNHQAAALIYKIFTLKKPSARYSTARNKFKNWTLLKIMPTKVRDTLVAKIFGLQ